MSTCREGNGMHAVVSFDEAQLQRALTAHLAAASVEWLGCDVDLPAESDAIDVRINELTVSMGPLYVAMNTRSIDFIVLEGTGHDASERLAVVLSRDAEDWSARQALYCFSVSQEEEGWRKPPSLDFFL